MSRAIDLPHPAGTLSPDDLWVQTWSGRAFPFEGFAAADIDLHGDVAETLARICRYGGRVQGPSYSVAQHCVIGCDAAMEETGDGNLAAYVLLHDAHEAVIGDIVTPAQKWLAALERHLTGRSHVEAVIATAKAMLDRAVWRAAGLPPPAASYTAMIDQFDRRLLATEQRQLMAKPPRSWGKAVDEARPIRLRGRLSAWPVARAADEFRDRLDRYCPTARRA